MKRISVCPICGDEFENTRIDKIYCSLKCTSISNSRKARERKRNQAKESCTICPNNEGVFCYKQNCSSCGWNPVVVSKRRAMLGLVEG